MLLKVFQNWQENTCVRAGLKLYKERESGTDIFLWFLQNFLRTPFFRIFPIYRYYLNLQFFEVFFLLTYPMCIYGSFGSLCICFCFTYRVITTIQIVLTLTKFVLYVCWLNKWPPIFLFLINGLMQEGEKNVKNPGNVLPMVQGKILGFLIKSTPKCLGQQN